MNKKIFFFAGEQSADALGSHLVSIAKKNNYTCVGIGGALMASAGLEIIDTIDNFQIMGFLSVLKNLPTVIYNFFKIRKLILTHQPDFVIFIDYPGLSLKLAPSLKKHGFKGKIVQYVCPSIWAWKNHRKKTLETYFDILFTLFDFEAQLFIKSKLKTYWCGHPFSLSQTETNKKSHIIIYPGSRASVIKNNLPVQIEAAKFLSKETNLPVGVSCSSLNNLELIKKITKNELPIFSNGDEKNLTKVAIATSGTITIELALREIPTAVTYKVPRIDGLIAKYFFGLNLPFYCIVNILLNKEIYKEFIGLHLDSKKIYEYLRLKINSDFPLLEFQKKVFNKNHDDIFLKALEQAN